MNRSRGFRTLPLLVLGLLVTILSPVLAPAASAATNAFVLAPPSLPNGLLHVFIPGTDLSAQESSKFLQDSVTAGFHAIGVNYPNSEAVGARCKNKGDACFGQVRRELVYGDTGTYDSHFANSPYVSVSPAASIVGQLTEELKARGGSWAGFLTTSGRVNWSKVVVSGHSQGAGHAAILGIDQSVSRVALAAGPNDEINSSPPSWTKAMPVTPEVKWYGLAHDKDPSKTKQLNSWNELFGFASDTATAPVPTGKHRLITTLSAPDNRFHESVVVDQYLNLENGTPALVPAWRSLLGAAAVTPVVASPVISPNGGSFATSQTVNLTTATAGATIHYTLNGTEPTPSSPSGTAGTSAASVTITNTTTVKAYAIKSGLTASAVVQATFTEGTTGSGGPAFESVATASGLAVSSVTVNKPTGTVAGNYLLAAIRQKKTTATVTPPAGWTLIREDTSSARSSLFGRIAAASEPPSYNFTLSGAADVAAQVLRFSGVNTTNPVDVHGVGTNSGGAEATTVEHPSLLTTGANTLYVAITSAKSSGLTVSPAPGTTEHSDASVNTTLATATEARATAGPTGARTATLSGLSDRRIGQAVALRSA